MILHPVYTVLYINNSYKFYVFKVCSNIFQMVTIKSRAEKITVKSERRTLVHTSTTPLLNGIHGSWTLLIWEKRQTQARDRDLKSLLILFQPYMGSMVEKWLTLTGRGFDPLSGQSVFLRCMCRFHPGVGWCCTQLQQLFSIFVVQFIV